MKAKKLNQDDREKMSNRLWNKLVKELSKLNDNNYTARKIFEYVERQRR